MNHCKTCKHWERDDGFGELPEAGKCKAVIQLWDATEWNEDGDGISLRKEYVGKLAFVRDASYYYAALHTLPEFGCVQHEEAP